LHLNEIRRLTLDIQQHHDSNDLSNDVQRFHL